MHAFFECVLNFKHAFQAHSGPCTSELYHMPIESGIMQIKLTRGGLKVIDTSYLILGRSFRYRDRVTIIIIYQFCQVLLKNFLFTDVLKCIPYQHIIVTKSQEIAYLASLAQRACLYLILAFKNLGRLCHYHTGTLSHQPLLHFVSIVHAFERLQ